MPLGKRKLLPVVGTDIGNNVFESSAVIGRGCATIDAIAVLIAELGTNSASCSRGKPDPINTAFAADVSGITAEAIDCNVFESSAVIWRGDAAIDAIAVLIAELGAKSASCSRAKPALIDAAFAPNVSEIVVEVIACSDFESSVLIGRCDANSEAIPADSTFATDA